MGGRGRSVPSHSAVRLARVGSDSRITGSRPRSDRKVATYSAATRSPGPGLSPKLDVSMRIRSWAREVTDTSGMGPGYLRAARLNASPTDTSTGHALKTDGDDYANDNESRDRHRVDRPPETRLRRRHHHARDRPRNQRHAVATRRVGEILGHSSVAVRLNLHRQRVQHGTHSKQPPKGSPRGLLHKGDHDREHSANHEDIEKTRPHHQERNVERGLNVVVGRQVEPQEQRPNPLGTRQPHHIAGIESHEGIEPIRVSATRLKGCLLYTSDAADE